MTRRSAFPHSRMTSDAPVDGGGRLELGVLDAGDYDRAHGRTTSANTTAAALLPCVLLRSAAIGERVGDRFAAASSGFASSSAAREAAGGGGARLCGFWISPPRATALPGRGFGALVSVCGRRRSVAAEPRSGARRPAGLTVAAPRGRLRPWRRCGRRRRLVDRRDDGGRVPVARRRWSLQAVELLLARQHPGAAPPIAAAARPRPRTARCDRARSPRWAPSDAVDRRRWTAALCEARRRA